MYAIRSYYAGPLHFAESDVHLLRFIFDLVRHKRGRHFDLLVIGGGATGCGVALRNNFV